VGSEYAVAVSNCTTALHLSLIVAGIGPGDEVICPSMSYIATANAIVYVGATPVFVEVKSETYNIDPEDVERKITTKTKAIIGVHQIGRPFEIDEIKTLCAKHSLILIEDAACAAGSAYKGNKIGSHSDLVCFSFHPRKVITTGDGGMIATSNVEYAERLKRLRQH
jgi:dTDP-4-amino-4,6-dideoxygalactose transaminase